MKKFLFIFVILIIIITICFGFNRISDDEKIALTNYINDIYNQNYSLPEFDDINEADEYWLWDNINQYLNNHSEYEQRNLKYCDYTYEEINNFAKKLYGKNLKKEFPIGNEIMIYDEENDKYGIPGYGLGYSYGYQIDSIKKKDNIYTVTIIDYAFSSYDIENLENPTENIFFYNSFEYLVNGDNSKEKIFSVKELKNYEEKVLENKDKFSNKILTIEYDKEKNEYHITSCKHENNNEEILKTYYKKMLDSYELFYFEYDINELTDASNAEVTNIDDITSIYTEKGKEIFIKTHPLLTIENEKVHVMLGGFFSTRHSTTFSDIKSSENKITCTVSTLFYKEPAESEISSIQKSYEFTIIKENNSWKIDEFTPAIIE